MSPHLRVADLTSDIVIDDGDLRAAIRRATHVIASAKAIATVRVGVRSAQLRAAVTMAVAREVIRRETEAFLIGARCQSDAEAILLGRALLESRASDAAALAAKLLEGRLVVSGRAL